MNSAPLADFLAQLGRSSVQASLLALAIWVVSRLLGSHLAPRWRCGLWLLVIIRLAWPFSLPSPVSLFNLVAAPGRLSRPDAPSFWLPEELSNQAARWVEQSWVCWTWAAVATVLMTQVLVGWGWTFWLRHSAKPMDSWEAWLLLKQCKEALGLDVSISILESSSVKSPCLLGFLRPRLVLPCGLWKDLSRDELRLVFLHELAHLCRRDLALNWLLAAVETFHWFNPLVWLVTRSLRADREEACDAYALAAQPEARRVYGETLLKLLERAGDEAFSFSSPARAGILGDTPDDLAPLIHRMRAIAAFRSDTRTWVVGLCTWVAFACVGLTDAEPRLPSEGGEVIVTLHSGGTPSDTGSLPA